MFQLIWISSGEHWFSVGISDEMNWAALKVRALETLRHGPSPFPISYLFHPHCVTWFLPSSDLPLPSPRVGSERRFYWRSVGLSRARETVARVLPPSEGTHIEILFWLVFQIAFRRSARWVGKDGGCRRSRTVGVGTFATRPNSLFIYFIILYVSVQFGLH
jgi:hypothetical protein